MAPLPLSTHMARLYRPLNAFSIPFKVKRLGKQLFHHTPLTGESLIYSHVRKVFEAIGAFFIIANALFSLPLMAAGMKFYDLCHPAKCYQIRHKERAVTQEDVRLHLLSIFKSRFKFDKIHIIQNLSYPQLTLSKVALTLLKTLRPKEIKLWNASIKADRLKELETREHYYSMQQIPGQMPCLYLKLENKIKHLVLPSNHTDMIQELERLLSAKQRVTCLYFTSFIPIELEDQVAELTAALAPDLQCLVSNERALSQGHIHSLIAN